MDRFNMIKDHVTCKVYTNTEEEELSSKEAKFAFGTIIGYLEKEDEKKETRMTYLVEPIDYRIYSVDKNIEGVNVEWLPSPSEFIDVKPDIIRLTSGRS